VYTNTLGNTNGIWYTLYVTKQNYHKFITIDPKIMAGKPVISGTRVPVELIIKKFAQNMDIKEILKDYPRLTKDAIRAALYYASETIANEEVYPLAA